MIQAYLLIAASFAWGVLIVRRLRTFDRHEPEPLWRMLLVTAWGGAWAMVFAGVMYGLVHSLGVGRLAARMALVGPVEELAKLLALVSCYVFIRRELDEPTDGVLYMACVALGFSLIENWHYAAYRPAGGMILLVRLAICTPVHIASSAMMGLAFYHMARTRRALLFLPLSWLYAAVLHGAYDLVLLLPSRLVLASRAGLVGPILVLALLAFAWRWTLGLLAYTNAISPHRPALGQFVASSSSAPARPGLPCPLCGSTADKTAITGSGFVIQKCDGCSAYLTPWRSLRRIFLHFGSLSLGWRRHYQSGRRLGREFSTLYKANRISRATRVAAFDLAELSAALEELNDAVRDRAEDRWWFPRRLRRTAPRPTSLPDRS